MTAERDGDMEIMTDDQGQGIDSTGCPKKHRMAICVNVHCSMNGSDELVDHLVSTYGIAPDVEMEEGLTVELTYCFGECDYGPNVDVDGELLEGVTKEQLDEIVAKLNGSTT